MKAKKLFKKLMGVTALTLAAGLMAVSVSAETDQFISESGIFDYFPSPTLVPAEGDEISSPADGWSGIFYAPGTGLEMRIYYNRGLEGGDTCECDLYNYYASSEDSLVGGWMLQAQPDGTAIAQDTEGITFGKLEDGSFTVDFSDSFLQEYNDGRDFYKRQTSAVFTDVYILTKDAGEDEWKGAYFNDDMQSESNISMYASVVPLYNSGDYYIVIQSDEYGTPTEGYSNLFYTESDGALINETVGGGENSIVPEGETWLTNKITLEEENGQKILRMHEIWQGGEDSGAYSDYYWCSSGYMWR